jgi:hypothetical protein
MPTAFILPPYKKKEIKEINYFENINKNSNENENDFEFLNLKDEPLLDFLIKKTAGFSGAEVVSVVQVYIYMYIYIIFPFIYAYIHFYVYKYSYLYTCSYIGSWNVCY